MKRLIAVSAPLLLMLLLSTECSAQSDFRRWELFVESGGSFYTGNTGPGSTVQVGPPGGPFQLVQATAESQFTKAWRVIGGTRYWFRKTDALEFTFSFSPNRFRLIETFPSGLGSGVSTDFQTDARNIAFNYVRAFSTNKRIHPFVTAGAGVAIFLDENDVDKEAKFVVNFGAGADVRLSHRWLIRFEIRDFFSAQPTGNVFRAPSGATHNVVPSAGLVLRF